jgi:hypothetical protein
MTQKQMRIRKEPNIIKQDGMYYYICFNNNTKYYCSQFPVKGHRLVGWIKNQDVFPTGKLLY